MINTSTWRRSISRRYSSRIYRSLYSSESQCIRSLAHCWKATANCCLMSSDKRVSLFDSWISCSETSIGSVRDVTACIRKRSYFVSNVRSSGLLRCSKTWLIILRRYQALSWIAWTRDEKKKNNWFLTKISKKKMGKMELIKCGLWFQEIGCSNGNVLFQTR